MKRIIIIESLLIFIFAILVTLFVPHLQQAIIWFKDIHWNIAQGFSPHPLSYKYAYTNLSYSIFSFLAAIADIAVMVLIAIKEFKVFQPLIDKHNARKQERAAARTAKAESEKRKRIEQLQAELEELRKDE